MKRNLVAFIKNSNRKYIWTIVETEKITKEKINSLTITLEYKNPFPRINSEMKIKW